MLIFKQAAQLFSYSKDQKIGFVPTMGALHKGHISLIQRAKKENDIVVCSIFINPSQFNNSEDFTKYPVTIERDTEQLIEAQCDILFLPSVLEMYPSTHTKKHYALGRIETLLEGYHRPNHFQGVCEVVDRLLEIVKPHQVYLGQKDYQQCMVINKLVEILGKKEEYKLIICPTLRAGNGLAMSSRNLRLSEEDQQKAGAIYRTLLYIKEHINKPLDSTKQVAVKTLEAAGFTVDYVEIADATTLEPATSPSQKLVGLVAATISNVRLIDNMLLN